MSEDPQENQQYLEDLGTARAKVARVCCNGLEWPPNTTGVEVRFFYDDGTELLMRFKPAGPLEEHTDRVPFLKAFADFAVKPFRQIARLVRK
jgi:hypothetical protein